MLQVTCYVNKFFKRNLEAASLDRGANWVSLQNPTDQELGRLSKKIRIPLSDLKDYIDPDERPRVEELKNWSLIIFRAPAGSDKNVRASSMAFLLSGNTVITLSRETVHALEAVHDLPENKKSKLFERGTDYLAFRLLDEIISAYFNILGDVEEQAEKIEQTILKDHGKTMLDDLFKVKKTIVLLHRALLANREVIAGVEKGYLRHVSKPILRYFRDLYNDCVQLIELEETQRDILTGLTDIHLSVTSTHLNKIVKTLTIIAAFIWMPALIAGIYGMNFFSSKHPLAMPEIQWMYGYPFALGLMITSVIITALVFKKKGWF